MGSKDQSTDKSRPHWEEEEIKRAFDTFDLDKTRFVGAHELLHIMQLIGEEVNDEEIDEMIRMCDTDGDGQVTFDEFYKLMTQPPPPMPTVAPRQSQSNRQRLATGKRYTTRITTPGGGTPKHTDGQTSDWVLAGGSPTSSSKSRDRTKSGDSDDQADNFREVSVETLVRKLSGGLGKIKPSQIKKIYKRFQEIDVNNSGDIDYEEFIQVMELQDTQVSRRMFRIFDIDGSGFIKLKEFIVMLSRYTSATKSEKLKFAFMMFDEDGSGEIDRDELIAMLRSSFAAEGYSNAEIENRANMVFDFLYLPRDGNISYKDFSKLSATKNGLIYPDAQWNDDD